MLARTSSSRSLFILAENTQSAFSRTSHSAGTLGASLSREISTSTTIRIMALTRCSAQNNKSLEAFYSEMASDNNSISARIGEEMLNVICFINNSFPEFKIYGLTSHAQLLLLSEDNTISECHIRLIANENEYLIEYLNPEKIRVKCEVKTFEELQTLIKIAILQIQDWT